MKKFEVKCDNCGLKYLFDEIAKCPGCGSEVAHKTVSIKFGKDEYDSLKQYAKETGINNIATTVRHMLVNYLNEKEVTKIAK